MPYLHWSGILHNVEWWSATDVSGQPIGPVFKGQAVQSSCTAWPLKMGQLRRTVTSVTNYYSTLPNITEERRSHSHRGGSLK